jgi:hypothetical protein
MAGRKFYEYEQQKKNPEKQGDVPRAVSADDGGLP